MVLTLPEIREILIDKENKSINGQYPQYLFRGQKSIYSAIKSNFARIDAKTVMSGQAYTVCRRAEIICSAISGYTIEGFNSIAVLQHYGWPTSMLDLTGTSEVAIYFALYGASIGNKAVIYSINCAGYIDDVDIIDHMFLAYRLKDGGLRHRWIRQNGYGFLPKGWVNSDISRSFNLLNEKYSQYIESYEFIIRNEDRANIEDILSIDQDPIPEKLQSGLSIFCKDVFNDKIDIQLDKIINDMYP